MPCAPGIQSLPTLCTQPLKASEATVSWLISASVSTAIPAASSAATASPVGRCGCVEFVAIPAAAAAVRVSSSPVVMVSLLWGGHPRRVPLFPSDLRSRGLQLGDGRAQTEGDDQVEERQPDDHGHRVAKPRALHHLAAIAPEDEGGHHGQRQRDERAELLELEE